MPGPARPVPVTEAERPRGVRVPAGGDSGRRGWRGNGRRLGWERAGRRTARRTSLGRERAGRRTARRTSLGRERADWTGSVCCGRWWAGRGRHLPGKACSRRTSLGCPAEGERRGSSDSLLSTGSVGSLPGRWLSNRSPLVEGDSRKYHRRSCQRGNDRHRRRRGENQGAGHASDPTALKYRRGGPTPGSVAEQRGQPGPAPRKTPPGTKDPAAVGKSHPETANEVARPATHHCLADQRRAQQQMSCRSRRDRGGRMLRRRPAWCRDRSPPGWRHDAPSSRRLPRPRSPGSAHPDHRRRESSSRLPVRWVCLRPTRRWRERRMAAA
jgi:hypothetical protein